MMLIDLSTAELGFLMWQLRARRGMISSDDPLIDALLQKLEYAVKSDTQSRACTCHPQAEEPSGHCPIHAT